MNERLLRDFEQFLRVQYKLDSRSREQIAKDAVDRGREEVEFSKKYPFERFAYFTTEQIKAAFEDQSHRIASFGNEATIADSKLILTHMLDLGITDGRTLSIGCGPALYEVFLASRKLITAEIIAADFVPGMVQEAQRLANWVGTKNVRSLLISSGSEIEFEDEFDQILIIDSLQMMHQWRDCLRRSTLALTEGGRVYISLDKPPPIIPVDENDVLAALIAEGMDPVGIKYDQGSSCQIASVLAVKRDSSNSSLLIPVVR